MRDTLFMRCLPAVLWAILIFSTSAISNPYQPFPREWMHSTVLVHSPSGPEPVSHEELLGRFSHAAEYLVLAVLTAHALVWRDPVRLRSLAGALGMCMLYALSDELHQTFVPGRAFQLADLALDLIGCLAGLAIYAFLHELRKQPAQLSQSLGIWV